MATFGRDDKDDIATAQSIDFGNGTHNMVFAQKTPNATGVIAGQGLSFGTGADNLTVSLAADNQVGVGESSYIDLGNGTNSLAINGDASKSGTYGLKGGTTAGTATMVLGGSGVDKVTIAGVASGVDGALLDLGAGNNVVNISAKVAALTNGATIKAGSGSDNVTLTGSINGSTVDLGDGVNSVVVNGKVTNATFTSGSGADNYTITGDVSGGSLDAGAGNNAITIKGEVKSGFSLRTGNGADKIVISGTVQDSSINTGDGNDSLTLSTVKNSTISLGFGKDTVTVEALTGNSVLNLGDGANKVTVGKVDAGSSITLGAGNDTLYIAEALGAGTVIDGGSDAAGKNIDLLNVSQRASLTLRDIYGEGTIKGFEAIDLTDKVAGGLYVRSEDVKDAASHVQMDDLKGLSPSLDKTFVDGSGLNSVSALLQTAGANILRVHGDAGDTVYFEGGWNKIGTVKVGGISYNIIATTRTAGGKDELSSEPKFMLVSSALKLAYNIGDSNLTLHSAGNKSLEQKLNVLTLDGVSGSVSNIKLQDDADNDGTVILSGAGYTVADGKTFTSVDNMAYAKVVAGQDGTLATTLMDNVYSKTSYQAALKAAQAEATAAAKLVAANSALQKAVTAAQTALSKITDTKSVGYATAQSNLAAAEAALSAAQAKSSTLNTTAENLAGGKAADGSNIIIMDDKALASGASVQYSYTLDGKTYTRTLQINVDEAASYTLGSSTKGTLYSAQGDDVYKITGSASNSDETVSIDGALLKGSKIDMAAGKNVLQAGNTTVAVAATGSTILTGKDASTVSITGDSGISATTVTTGAGNDTVTIISTNKNTVATEPLSPHPSATTYRGTGYAVSGGIINVGNGDNSVKINTQTGVGMTDNAKLIAGTGNDSIEVAALARYGWAVSGGSIAAGEGNNSIKLGGLVGLGSIVNASGKVTTASSITTGKGNDRIEITGPSGEGLLTQMGVGMYYSSIKDTGGDNTITINYDGGSGAASMHNSTITLGAGNDEVTMSSVYSGNLFGFIQTTMYGKSLLDTGAGDDKVTLSGNVTGTNSKNMVGINLGAGQNTLSVAGDIAYATVTGGAGKDSVSIIGTTGGTYGIDSTAKLQPAKISYATINLGGGDNELTIGDVAGTLGGAGSDILYSSVVLGTGADTAHIIGHLDSSSIKDSGGNNAITLSSTTAEGIILTNSSVSLGAGHDTLKILASGKDGKAIFGKSSVDTGAGNDRVDIIGHVQTQATNKAATINLGAGNNTLSIDGDVGFLTYIVDRDNYVWADPAVSNYVTITGGAQSDVIAITGTISGATVNAGAGNDSVTIGKGLGNKAILAGGAGRDTLNVAGIGIEVMADQYLLDTSTATLAGSSGKISGFEVLDVGSDDGLRTLLTITGNLPSLMGVDSAIKYTVTPTTGKAVTYNEKALIVTGGVEDSYRLGADWTVLGVTTVSGVEYTVLQHSGGKSRILVDNTMSIRETTGYTNADDVTENGNFVDVAISLQAAFEKTFGSLEWSTMDLGSGADTVTVTDKLGVSIVNTGAGDDILHLSGETVSSTINMGAGNDSLTVKSATTSSFDLGDGNDTVQVDFATGSAFELGNGSDVLTVSNAKSSTFSLGAGNDSTTLNGGTDLKVNLGSGQDSLTINGNVDGVTVTTQGGDNSLSIAGVASSGLVAKAGEVYETTGTASYPYTSHKITVTPTEYATAEGVTKNVSVTFGAGKDTLRIGDSVNGAVLAGGYFDVGDGDNVVDVHLQKAYYVKNENYRVKSSSSATAISTDTTYEVPAVTLAGNLGEATIRISEDPALVAEGRSYLNLQIGSALSDSVTHLGATTVAMGAGTNTLSVFGTTALAGTTFTFDDTSTNLISIGGDTLSIAEEGIYLNDVTFNLGNSTSHAYEYGTNRFDAWGMRGLANKLTVNGIGEGTITMDSENDTVSLTLGEVPTGSRYLNIDLGAGNDSLTVTTDKTGKVANLTVKAGDGDDSIHIDMRTTSANLDISNATAGHTTVLMGDMDDTFKLTATSGAFIDTEYNLGEGNNSLAFANNTGKALDNVTLVVGSGANRVTVTSGDTNDVLTIDGNVTSSSSSSINVGAGNDHLTLKNGTYSTTLSINMGDGNDTLTFAGKNAIATTSAGKATILAGGAGTDVLQVAGLMAEVGDSERMLTLGKDQTFAQTTGFEILDISQLEGTDKSVLTISGKNAINLGADVPLAYTVTLTGGGTATYTEAVLRITGKSGDAFKLFDGWSVVGSTTLDGVTYSVVQTVVTSADGKETHYRILVDNKLTYMADTAINSIDGVVNGATLSHVAITLEEALNRSITSLKWSTINIGSDGATSLTITDAFKTSSLTTRKGDDTLAVQTMLLSTVSLGDGNNSLTATTVSNSSITTGTGNDVLSLDAIEGSTVVLGDGSNLFTAQKVTSSSVTAGADADTATLANVTGSTISLGAGANTLSVSGTVASSNLVGGAGDDSFTLNDITASTVNLGAGTNMLTVNGTAKGANVTGASGVDSFVFKGTVDSSTIAFNAGSSNSLTLHDTITSSSITGTAGANKIDMVNADSTTINLTGGNNTVTATGVMNGGSLTTGAGNDSITLQKAVNTSINISAGGNDTLNISEIQGNSTIALNDNATKAGDAQLNVTGSAGNDTLTFKGRFSANATSAVSMQGGNDVLVLDGTSITAKFMANMGDGDDTVKLAGALKGVDALHIDGGNGTDVILAEGLLNQLTTGTAVNEWSLTMDSGLLPGTVTGFEVLNIASADGGRVLLTIAGDAPATLGGTDVSYNVGGTDYTKAALILTGAAGDSFKLGEGWTDLGSTTLNGKKYTVISNGSSHILVDAVLSKVDSDTNAADSVMVAGANLAHTHVTLTQAVASSTALSSLSWATLDLAAANNALTVSGAVKASTINGGGNDTIKLLGAVSGSDISLGGGNSSLTTGAMFGHTSVKAGAGNDVLSLGTVTSSTVNLGDGANVLTTGDVSYGTLIAGAGKNTITLGTAASSTAVGMGYSSLVTGNGDNNVTVKGLTSYSTMHFGSGSDTVSLTASTTSSRCDYNVIDLGAGDNKLSVTGSYRYGAITAENGNNTVSINPSSTAFTTSSLTVGNGNNSIALGSTSSSTVSLGHGKNTVAISTLSQSLLNGGDGGNKIDLTSVATSTVNLGLGQDVVTVATMSGSSALPLEFNLGGGSDSFAVSTSATYGNIRMGAGDDTVSFGTSAKAVTSISNVAVDLGDGVNKLSVYAGTSTAANSLTVSGAVSGDSAMTFGTGADKLTFDNATLTSGMTVNLGAGADTLALTGSTAGRGSFNGGTGIDVLNLGGLGADLVFSDLFNSSTGYSISGFERIDLTGGTANTLTLTAADVANLKGEALSEALSYTSTDGAGGSIAVGGYVSYVTGDTEDSVKLVAGDWTSMGSLTGTDGAYNVYQAAEAGRYLLVQQKLNIQNV